MSNKVIPFNPAAPHNRLRLKYYAFVEEVAFPTFQAEFEVLDWAKRTSAMSMFSRIILGDEKTPDRNDGKQPGSSVRKYATAFQTNAARRGTDDPGSGDGDD